MMRRGGGSAAVSAGRQGNKQRAQGRSPAWRPTAIVVLFIFRVVFAFSLRTAESPDEWWQSAEVAYYMTFGKGHLTWEWKEGIRSVVFPALYAFPFYVLKSLHLDSAGSIYAAERLVQACIATAIDWCMMVLAGRIDAAIAKDEASELMSKRETDQVDIDGVEMNSTYHSAMMRRRGGSWIASPSVEKTVVWLAVMQWYITYDGARAYSNVAEGLFVMLALLQRNYVAFLMTAGVACMIRVTAAIALFPIFLFHVLRQFRRRGIGKGLCYCLFGSVFAVAVVVGAMMSVDYIFYKRWILTPLNFLHFNIIMKVSEFYGVYPWWWYFVVGFPVAVGPHLVFLLLCFVVLARLRRSGRSTRCTRAIIRRLLALVVWTLSCHSAVAHKEVRFMFPMLPVALVLIAFTISSMIRLPHVLRFLPLRSRKAGTMRYIINASRVACLHRAFLTVNVALLVILSFFYRQGGVGVMAAIRNAPQPYFERVDIVTHCYFTPGYSQVHGKVGELRVVDCPMQLDQVTGKPRLTTDILYRQFPVEFVSWAYQRRLSSSAPSDSPEFDAWLHEMQVRMPAAEAVELPSAIVVFSFVSDAKKDDFFVPSGYRLQNHVFHAPKSFEEDEDSYVDLWVRS